MHGDLAGNVLFADERPPAVIDFSPYWRPAGFALAVAAVDLLLWSEAEPAILDELDGEQELDQLLARALVYRLVPESLARPDAGSPSFDLHVWLVSLHAEGGPPPDVLQGPGAAAHAALLAGRQALLAPSRDSNRPLFEQRRACLAVALGWAARLLGLPAPGA